MKKLILTCLVLTMSVSLFAAPASAQTKGWGGGLQVFDGEFGFQFRKDIALGGDISKLTGQLGMLFPSDALLTFDLDYHFVIKNESGTSRFYPLVGLDLKTDFDNTEFGLNAGGGVNFMLTDRTAAFGEVKYTFSDWDGFGFAVGIYF